MFLGIIFVEKHPVLFDVRGLHNNFCQDCSCVKTNERLKVHAAISYSDYNFMVKMFKYYFIL